MRSGRRGWWRIWSGRGGFAEMPRPKASPLCFRCGVAQRVPNCCYCRECKRARERQWLARHKSGARQRRSYARIEGCNCGDAGCNGLSCERVSA